jgi:hypothetical protein
MSAPVEKCCRSARRDHQLLVVVVPGPLTLGAWRAGLTLLSWLSTGAWRPWRLDNRRMWLEPSAGAAANAGTAGERRGQGTRRGFGTAWGWARRWFGSRTTTGVSGRRPNLVAESLGDWRPTGGNPQPPAWCCWAVGPSALVASVGSSPQIGRRR